MTVMDDSWWIGSESEGSFEQGIHTLKRRRQTGATVKRFLRKCLDRLDDTCSKLCVSTSSEEAHVVRYRKTDGSPLSRLQSLRVSVSQEDLQKFASMGEFHDWSFTIEEDDDMDEVKEGVEVKTSPYRKHYPRTTPPKELLSFSAKKTFKEKSCNRILFHDEI